MSEDKTNAWKRIGSLLEGLTHLMTEAGQLGLVDAGLNERVSALREKWRSQTFRVAVLALAKSGKSSLINAWLGGEFLPMSNNPETARIVRIRHDLAVPHGKLSVGASLVADGPEAIRAWLTEANKSVRASKVLVDREDLLLCAPIMGLENLELGEIGFELVDTPGPNESGIEQLRERVDRLLAEADVLVYVLDYTKLKTDSERTLFTTLSRLRPELLRDCSDRLFFVLNKIDRQDRNGLSPDAAVSYVQGLLETELGGVKIPSERILPASASFALLSRLMRAEHPRSEAVADFAKEWFGRSQQASDSRCKAAAPEMLRESRLLALESAVLGYVFDSRAKILADAMVVDILRAAGHLENIAGTTLQATSMDRSRLEEALRRLRGDLQETRGDLTKVGSMAGTHSNHIEAFVRTQMSRFHREVRERVSEVLDNRRGPVSSVWGWLKGQVEHLVSGVAPDPRGSLQAVNGGISQFVAQEFAAFRNELEGRLLDQQTALYAELQRVVTPLVAKAERKIGAAFQINLNPVPVRMPDPGLEGLHRAIDGQVDRMVGARTHTWSTTSQRTVLIQRRGFCTAEKYGFEPTIEWHSAVDREALLQDLREEWLRHIDALAEESLHTARAVIQRQVSGAIAAVTERVELYVGGYVKRVEEELAREAKGSAEKELRVSRLVSITEEVSRFRVRCENTRESIVGTGRRRNQVLSALLSELFDAEGLRHWVRQSPFSADLQGHLPSSPVSAVGLADAVSDLLHRRGYVDSNLFQVLVEAVPRRKDHILLVRESWLSASE